MSKKTESLILGMISGKADRIVVNIEKPNLLQKLLKKTQKVYFVKPLNLDKFIKITKIWLDMPVFDIEKMKNEDFYAEAIKLAGNHCDKLIKVTGIVLEEKNLKLLKRNLTNDCLLKLYFKIVEVSNFGDFMSTITLIRKKVSLKNE